MQRDVVSLLGHLRQPQAVRNGLADLVERVHRAGLAAAQLFDERDALLQLRLPRFELLHLGQHRAQLLDFGLPLRNLLANLESSAWFKKPIDIIDSQVDASNKTGEMFKFSLKAVFSNPDAPAPPVPQRGAKPGAPAAPKG